MQPITVRFRLLLLLAALTTPSALRAAEVGSIVGPLVGQATPDSIDMWIYIAEGDKAEVVLDVNGQQRRTAFKPIENLAADKLAGQAAKATVDGLSADRTYEYQIAIDGNVIAALSGRFQTAPPAGEPAKFRVGLTSCMKIGQVQASWKLFLKEQPDLHLTLGDTHYADTTNPNVQWEHHLRYRRQPEFAEVIRNVPNYAMWDDHDYGPNNSDGTAKGKEGSLAGWKQVWCNPGAGTEDTPGAFFKFRWGQVDFFVVDGRYHRSPDNAPDDEKKRMLGDAQFAWLLDGLKTSDAKFKVIASGSTLRASGNDGWRIYTFSRHRLMDALKEHNINGVVYMSGDIHRCEVEENPESDRVGYPLVEVISSGVANSRNLSFATIDFDTTKEDPTMQVRIIMADGQVSVDKTWQLSELSH